MWNRLFKQWASVAVKEVLQSIPLSLFFSLLVMFFVAVIASREASFLSIWKWTYLLMVGAFQAVHLYGVLVIGLGIRSQAKLWNMPTNELYEAITDLKVHTALEGGMSEFFEMTEAEAKAHIAKCIEINKSLEKFVDALFDGIKQMLR